MIQIQLISSLVGWERKLQVTEERRKHHRSESYVNYLAAPQPIYQGSNYCEESQRHADFVKALNLTL